MPRVVLVLTLCSLALYGSTAARAAAKAAESGELSRCLDASTKLEAGGDVSDKELAEAQQACASVKQSTKDTETIARVTAAASNLTAEAGRRKSGH
jgi:hypothetical protein